MSQAEVNQLRADIGFARDQILSFLGVEHPQSAPAKVDHDTALMLENARRSDVGYAMDQIIAAIKTLPLSDTDVDRIAHRVAGLISPTASSRETERATADVSPTVIYLHGAGNKPPQDALKRDWDHDLFGRDMADRTRMAYYADLLFPQPASIGPDACTPDAAITDLPGMAGASVAEVAQAAPQVDAALVAEQAQLISKLPVRGQQFAMGLAIEMATRAATQPPPQNDTTAVLPLPPAVRRLILRQLLQQLIPDAAAYFFGSQRTAMQDRFRQALEAVNGPVVVVAHSLGTAIAYDVLSEPRFAGHAVPLLVTLGAPLGYTEIQDVITKPLQIPGPVQHWANFADQLDLITLDTTLSDDFGADPRITDTRVDNRSPNNHAACGYLRTTQVRSRVTAALPAVITI